MTEKHTRLKVLRKGPTTPPEDASHWIRGLLRQPRGLAAIVYLTLLVFAGLFAEALAPYPPGQQDLLAALSGPSGAHWLGTDALGRDVLSRVLVGIIPSLENAAIALVVFLAIGVPFGILAGYRGGWVGSAIGRITDLALTLPPIILVLVVLAVFSSSPTAAMVTLGLLGAPGLIRVVRGATLVVREELFVTAAKVSGVRPSRIMSGHILRRVLGPILAQATIFAGVGLVFQAALSFLGLLSSPGSATWGGMIGSAADVITQHAWLLFPPGATLALTVLAFGLLGDTIRDLTSDETQAKPRKTPSRAPSVPQDPGPDTDTHPTPVLLDVRGLEITAGDAPGLTLVDDASFAIHSGETLAVVGESGCGKSITALAVLGLLPDGVTTTGGNLLFEDRDLLSGGREAYRAVRGSGIGYVAQDALGSLDPTHTIGSHLREVIGCHERLSKTASRARALELLHQVKIPDPERVLRIYPHEISGGMAQRVNIAIALAGRPRLLVADEPTTALDVTVQAEILRLLRELRDSTDMAVLLITHDLGVVADIADRAVVMYAGEVVEQADVETLFTTPRFPYTAALLAADPSLTEDGAELPTLPGRVPAPGNRPTGCRFAGRCAFTAEECTAGPIPLMSVSERSATRCVRVENLVGEGALPQ